MTIEVRATRFDYQTGKLLQESKWVTAKKSKSACHTYEDICFRRLEFSSNFSLTLCKYFLTFIIIFFFSILYRNELILDAPDARRTYPINLPNSVNGQYVEFLSSDIRDDVGQATFPFFDSTIVMGTPNFPLGGIGLYHRGNKGGFVAFKIMGLNLTNYLV